MLVDERAKAYSAHCLCSDDDIALKMTSSNCFVAVFAKNARFLSFKAKTNFKFCPQVVPIYFLINKKYV